MPHRNKLLTKVNFIYLMLKLNTMKGIDIMSTQTLHGQLSVVDESGNVQILHQETSATDDLINNTTNTQGASGSSAIPASADTVQKLTDKLGTMAFKSVVKISDLEAGTVVNNLETEVEGAVLDARAGKDLNDRLTEIEESDVLVIGCEEENTDIVVPESEINDNITSDSLTWSSSKIESYITETIANIANAEDNRF